MRARYFVLALLLTHGTGASAACLAIAPSLAFGPYDGLSGAATTTSANVVVTCDQAPAPVVTIAIGPSGVSGGFAPRRMGHIGSSDTLAYNLYTDAAATSIWGDGSGGTATRSQRVQKNQPWAATIYGRIPPGQDVAAGSYSDVLTITVNF